MNANGRFGNIVSLGDKAVLYLQRTIVPSVSLMEGGRLVKFYYNIILMYVLDIILNVKV